MLGGHAKSLKPYRPPKSHQTSFQKLTKFYVVCLSADATCIRVKSAAVKISFI